jgi:hypothetical protein
MKVVTPGSPCAPPPRRRSPSGGVARLPRRAMPRRCCAHPAPMVRGRSLCPQTALPPPRCWADEGVTVGPSACAVECHQPCLHPARGEELQDGNGRRDDRATVGFRKSSREGERQHAGVPGNGRRIRRAPRRAQPPGTAQRPWRPDETRPRASRPARDCRYRARVARAQSASIMPRSRRRVMADTRRSRASSTTDRKPTTLSCESMWARRS